MGAEAHLAAIGLAYAGMSSGVQPFIYFPELLRDLDLLIGTAGFLIGARSGKHRHGQHTQDDNDETLDACMINTDARSQKGLLLQLVLLENIAVYFVGSKTQGCQT